jgi:hypothetical protein
MQRRERHYVAGHRLVGFLHLDIQLEQGFVDVAHPLVDGVATAVDRVLQYGAQWADLDVPKT